MITSLLAALLGFPGVLFGLALATGCSLLRGWRPRPLGVLGPVPLIVALLALLALVALPWPLHPLAGQQGIGSALLAWGLLEAAFLAPLLLGLTADAAGPVRVASREAQMGSAGRAVLWLALAAGTALGPAWQPETALPRLLLGLAALLALPQALGTGPFAAEQSVASTATSPALAAAAGLRDTALLAATALLWVPPAATPTPAFTLALIIGATALLALLLGQLDGRYPRMPLPHALRWCWSLPLPLALAGIVYLALRA